MLAQRRDHARRVFSRHFHQYREARLLLHQGGDVRILGTCNQVPFPVTRNRVIVHISGTVPDGEAIDDLSSGLTVQLRKYSLPLYSCRVGVRCGPSDSLK